MDQQDGASNVAGAGGRGRPESSHSADASRALQGTAGDGAHGSPETPLWEGRGDWRYQIGSVGMFIVVTLLVVIVIAFVIQNQNKSWLWWLGALVVLAFALRTGWILLVHVYGTRYRLTSQRLFIDRGLLSRTTDQLELIRVDDVRVRQRVVDRLFHIGSVDVLSTDVSDAKMSIVGIAGPDAVAEHIRTNMRQLRQKSLFIENL